MIRRPPILTGTDPIITYTTLFLSDPVRPGLAQPCAGAVPDRLCAGAPAGLVLRAGCADPAGGGRLFRLALAGRGVGPAATGRRRRGADRDRKSTRLNSSH